MERISQSLEDTRAVAESFVKGVKPLDDRARVVGLYGDLGAGKTTFMKYVAEALGITETIQSPTFVIEKIYDLQNKKFDHLVHIDAYRLESPQELTMLGWSELVADPRNLICIEWPERVADIMPPHTRIMFEHVNEKERKITIQ